MKKQINRADFAKSPNMNFLKKLTTETGVLQHTSYGIPERSLGYALDDNARALVAAVEYYKLYRDEEWLEKAVKYLSFLIHSKRADGFFYNFQSFDNTFVETTSEDAFGEVVWALGVVINSNPRSDLFGAASRLFAEIRSNIKKLKYARARAYCLIGLAKIAEKDKSVLSLIEELSAGLVRQYEASKSENWNWFEDKLSYGNYIIPAGLFEAAKWVGDEKIKATALESLKFLNFHCFDKGIPSPIGSDGWLEKGKTKSLFDQQPVDAGYGVLANVSAFNLLKEEIYLDRAKVWFSWFHGNNIKHVQVCDRKTGSCYDSVNREGVNLNQGAESVICYILAHLALTATSREEEVLEPLLRSQSARLRTQNLL